MRYGLILSAVLACALSAGAQFVPRMDRTTELGDVLVKQNLTLHEAATLNLYWTFTYTNAAWPLTGANQVWFRYAPTNGAWQQTITGSVDSAADGRVLVPFTIGNTATNGVYQWDLQVSSNGVSLMMHPYGNLTLVRQLGGGGSTNAFPTAGTNINLAGKSFINYPWDLGGAAASATQGLATVAYVDAATGAITAASGDITSITSATPAQVYVLGGDSGDVGVGVSNVATAAQGATADSALQPAATNGWNVAAFSAWLLAAETNGWDIGASVKPADTNAWNIEPFLSWLLPAATNGWNIEPFSAWLLPADTNGWNIATGTVSTDWNGGSGSNVHRIITDASGYPTNVEFHADAGGAGGGNSPFTNQATSSALTFNANQTNTQDIVIDADSKGIYFGADQDASILWAGSELTIEAGGGVLVSDTALTIGEGTDVAMTLKFNADIPDGTIVYDPASGVFTLNRALALSGNPITNVASAAASVSNNQAATTKYVMDTAGAEGWGSGGAADGYDQSIDTRAATGNVNMATYRLVYSNAPQDWLEVDLGLSGGNPALIYYYHTNVVVTNVDRLN